MATDLVPPHELFNRKLMEFIDDLKPLVGHLPEHGILTKSVRLLANLDARANQRIFDQYLGEPYGERILKRDEAFFLNDCDQAYQYVAEWSQSPSSGIVPMLKQVWKDLAKQDRDAIWSHFQVLLVLSRRVAGKA